MNPNISIEWVLGGYGTIGVFMIATLFRMSYRLTKVESSFQTLVQILGKRAAILLHSPHTPRLDRWLEMLCHNQRIPDAEIQEFVNELVEIENNTIETQQKRHLATTVLLMLESIYKQRFNLGDITKRHGYVK